MKFALLQKFFSKSNCVCQTLSLTITNFYLLDATRDNFKSFYKKNDIIYIACQRSFDISSVSQTYKAYNRIEIIKFSN